MMWNRTVYRAASQCAAAREWCARRASSSTAAAISSISQDLPHVDISTNPYNLDSHGRGESYHPTARPVAVVTPTSVQDVQVIVAHCAASQTPIVPYGAGTSVEGHVCAIKDGSISLDMTLLTDIALEEPASDSSLADPIATVGAGVTRMRLNDELRFIVDPGADATIGGMVACGASGTTAARYGTMRENILGLECVLPDATLVKCGSKALKSSAGYDLTSLMCGSEGTLGVITSVTVKLHAVPEYVMAATCVFNDLHSAAEAVAALKLCCIPLARCELLDERSVAAFNQYNQTHNNDDKKKNVMEENPTLFFEFEGPSEMAVQEQVTMTQAICTNDYGGSNFEYTAGEAERRALRSARHGLYYSAIALRPGASDAIVTDACVPLSKFADLISATAKDVQDLNVVGPCFGHAADGNFHCILPMLDSDDQDYLDRLYQVNDNLIRRALEAGGTCTGEHGVGYGKIKYLEEQYGPGAVHMMTLIKQALDPLNILNPGKVLASR